MVPSKDPKLDRDPARRAWKDADSWRRYRENFYRTVEAIGPCALSPRCFVGLSKGTASQSMESGASDLGSGRC